MKGEHLGEFEILVLLALMRLQEDGYGMRVLKEIESEGRRAVSIGAIYATLSRLEKKGYVRSRFSAPTPERGGRSRRIFRLNAKGERALKRSLESLSRMVEGLSLGWSH